MARQIHSEWQEHEAARVGGSAPRILQVYGCGGQVEDRMISEYRRIFETLGSGILVLEPEEYRIIDLNPAACTLLGRKPGELIGNAVTSIAEDAAGLEPLLAAGEARGVLTVTGGGTPARHVLFHGVRIPEGVYLATLTDVTEEIEANELLETLLSLSPEPLFVLDGEGRIRRLYWGAAARYGIDPGAATGSAFSEIFSSPAKTAHQRARQGEMPQETRLRMHTAGRDRFFVTTFAPFESAWKGERLVLGAARDVTEEEREKKMADRIEREVDYRKDFIMTAAHELRTPLQPILGYLHLLMDDPEGFNLSEEARRMLGRCLENVERERYIVDRMLELSLLYEGKFRLAPAEVALRSVVLSIIGSSDYSEEAEITVDIPEDARVVADRDCLHSILVTLIDNAIRFNKPPKRVRVSYCDEGETHLITVRDNGIGMEKGVIAHIFEPFHLLDAEKLNRGFDRMGLSLSIAKKYVDLHGGEIEVESEPGVGSTFRVRLPKELPYEL